MLRSDATHRDEAATRRASVELESGSFAPPDSAREAPTRLVVVTYNIRYARGARLISDGLLRRAGLARPLGRSSLVARNVERAARAFSTGAPLPPPDLIALQEADRQTLRAGGRDVTRELARALRMHYVRAGAPTPRDVEPKDRQWWLNFEEPLRRGEEGDTGVALLSRLPLEEAARVELPWSDCPWRPRLALAASLAFGGGRLRVFNAHIDPHAGVAEQLAQHRAVLACADDGRPGPTLLLGDFNTLSRPSREATRALLEERGYTTPLPTGTGTWRSGPLRLHADWIFVRGLRILRWGVARDLRVSDHWPVWAEVEADGL